MASYSSCQLLTLVEAHLSLCLQRLAAVGHSSHPLPISVVAHYFWIYLKLEEASYS